MTTVTKKLMSSVVAIAAASLLTVSSVSVAQTKPPELDAWLKSAQLGSYAPAKENWDEVIAKAKMEGEVVIYSASGRIAKLVDAFQALYPEIKLTLFDLGSTKTVEKTIREQDAGIFNADIVTTGNSGVVIHEMLNKNRIFNYVPQNYLDRIPPENRDPLLIRVNEAIVVYYNTEAHPNGAPVKNIWELTEPAYKGRVGIINPLSSGSTFMAVATLAQHPEEMAAAYKRLKGKDIVLSDGVPDAAHEFLARLLKNDVVIFKSGSKLVAASGKKGQDKPLIAFAYMTYIAKNESDGFVNAIMTDLDPVSKLVYPTYTSIARQAPHPNAAKLMTAYLLGSLELNQKSVLKKPYTKGESFALLQGLAPYYDPGSVSPRSDVPMPPGGEIWPQMKGWIVSADFMQKEGAKIRDFWLLHSSK